MWGEGAGGGGGRRREGGGEEGGRPRGMGSTSYADFRGEGCNEYEFETGTTSSCVPTLLLLHNKRSQYSRARAPVGWRKMNGKFHCSSTSA